MSLIALAAGIITLGTGLGAPELPGLLERATASRGIETAAWPRPDAAPPAMIIPSDLILPPSEPRPEIWRDALTSFAPEARVWVLEGWPAAPTLDGQTWGTESEALRQDARARAASLSPEARVIPTTEAFSRAAKAAAAGALPGLSGPGDFYQTSGQLDDQGLYLVAMTVLAQIEGAAPKGVPARLTRLWMSRDSVVTPPMAEALQDIAWAAVEAATAPPTPEPVQATTAAPIDLPALRDGGVTRPDVGFNLSEITDWATQVPFLDLMKSARAWTGHKPGQWGGFEFAELLAGGWLDAEGWPKALPPGVESLSTMLLTDLPPDTGGVAGRYVLRHQGQGRLELGGRAQLVSQRPGEAVFDFHPGEGSVMLTLREIDPQDPLRAITILRADRVALWDAGEIFNPDWLDRLQGTALLRFMDWGQTNGSTLARLADQPRLSDFTWTWRGAPVEVMLALANRLGADAWFTLPHLAEDALIRDYALRVHQGLAPGLRAYVEYSNEVWNHMFAQSTWAEAEARARWGEEWKWVQLYALRATAMAEIWREVFADDPKRLVRVLGTQTGWLGLETDILDAPLVQAEGRPAPHLAFDALAITGYVGGALGDEAKIPLIEDWLTRSQSAAEGEAARLGLLGADHAAHLAAHRFDLAAAWAVEEMRDGRHSGQPHDTLQTLLSEMLPWQAEAAQKRGLKLVMYEGGSHVVGHGPSREREDFSAFFQALSYAPAMGDFYRDLLAGWRGLSDAPFAAFNDVQNPTKYGSWGALRHLGDDNPRWRALTKKDPQ